MSGEIFQPLESLEEVEGAKLDPLHCHLCNERFEDPRVLQCYHTFCSGCLRGRAQEGVMLCPFCGRSSPIDESTGLPREDSLMSFLVKSSEEDIATCANCDQTSSTMFFCNTCNQPLCTACKEETHKARMFASHTIVTLNKRTKEQHKKCAEHNEDYIMFSVDNSELLCIKCFRDMDKEDRADCVDLETAYNQGCNKLQERSNTIQELQSSVHDAIILFQALTQEVKTNAEEERKAIAALYSLMQEKMEETKADLLREVERQFQAKEKVFKEQLPTLAALLPTLHTTLAICVLFSKSANLYEFLDLSASLMERLSAIVDHPHQLTPQQSSKICSNFQVEFAKCLHPLLHTGCGDASSCQTSQCSSHGQKARYIDSSPYVSHHVARQHSRQATYVQTHRRMVKAAGNRQHFLLGSGPFIEHCKAFEANHKLINHRIQKMKEHIQELHRDITRRKCLSKKEAVSDILDECSQVDIQVNTQMATLEHMKIVFQRLWQETLERVSREQGTYETQLSEMDRLKQENGHLETIARQIAPFIASIATVTHRIDPKRDSLPDESHDDSLDAVMEQISTILPDSQPTRVDAIRLCEEEREVALQEAQCKPSQLEDDLIRTKEMLRSHDKSPVMERKEGSVTSDKDTAGGGDISPLEHIVILSDGLACRRIDDTEHYAKQPHISSEGDNETLWKGLISDKQSVGAESNLRKLHFIVDDNDDIDNRNHLEASDSSFDETNTVVNNQGKTPECQENPTGNYNHFGTGINSNTSNVQCKEELKLDNKSEIISTVSIKPNSRIDAPSDIQDLSVARTDGVLSQTVKATTTGITNAFSKQDLDRCSSDIDSNKILKIASGKDTLMLNENQVHDSQMSNGHESGVRNEVVRLKGKQGKKIPKRIKVTVTVDENN